MTAQKEIDKSELKLNNTNFLTNAPTEVIEKEKQRISKNKNLLKELQKQIRRSKRADWEKWTEYLVPQEMDIQDKWMGIKLLKKGYQPIPYTLKDEQGRRYRVDSIALCLSFWISNGCDRCYER